MCFSVALTRETIESDPRFSHLKGLVDRPGALISAFHFPGLPVLREGLNAPADLSRWGLVPLVWVRDEKKAGKIRQGTVNARWESLCREALIQGQLACENAAWFRWRVFMNPIWKRGENRPGIYARRRVSSSIWPESGSKTYI